MGHISWPLCYSWLNCIKTCPPRWVMLKSSITSPNSFSIVRYMVSNNVVRYIWNSGLGSYIRNLCMYVFFTFISSWIYSGKTFATLKNYFKNVKNAFHAKQYNSRRKRFYNNINTESKSSRSRLHKYLNHFSFIFDLWGREFFCWKISLFYTWSY